MKSKTIKILWNDFNKEIWEDKSLRTKYFSNASLLIFLHCKKLKKFYVSSVLYLLHNILNIIILVIKKIKTINTKQIDPQ